MVKFLLEIQKLLLKLAKEKNCEGIGLSRKACVRQFYWAATSTKSATGELKWAKFESFFHHVVNKHKNLPNKLFSKCNHKENITPRVWLKKGKRVFPNCSKLHGIKLINKVYLNSIYYLQDLLHLKDCTKLSQTTGS